MKHFSLLDRVEDGLNSIQAQYVDNSFLNTLSHLEVLLLSIENQMLVDDINSQFTSMITYRDPISYREAGTIILSLVGEIKATLMHEHSFFHALNGSLPHREFLTGFIDEQIQNILNRFPAVRDGYRNSYSICVRTTPEWILAVLGFDYFCQVYQEDIMDVYARQNATYQENAGGSSGASIKPIGEAIKDKDLFQRGGQETELKFRSVNANDVRLIGKMDHRTLTLTQRWHSLKYIKQGAINEKDIRLLSYVPKENHHYVTFNSTFFNGGPSLHFVMEFPSILVSNSYSTVSFVNGLKREVIDFINEKMWVSTRRKDPLPYNEQNIGNLLKEINGKFGKVIGVEETVTITPFDNALFADVFENGAIVVVGDSGKLYSGGFSTTGLIYLLS